ncbi:MAG TPA: alkaline phosphatase family protein [Mycobacterium sp.]|nr:alkaline phosphatase family protein [Mycobacterium sp.]
MTPQVGPAPFGGPLAPLNIVTSVLSTVLGWAGFGPSMTASPETPVQTPVLWTLLAFVRREIDQTLNLTPAAAVQQVSALTVESPNLLVNPGAELGDPSLSGYSSVTVPGWTVTGAPTVIGYGTQRRFPWPTASPGPTLPAFLGFPSSACAPPDSGAQFFGGGPVATSTLSQTVDLGAAASDIDAGTVPYKLSADLGGFTIDPSAASVTVDFLDANGANIGTGGIRPVTALDRWFQTGLLQRETAGTLPVGTRSAHVVVTLNDCNPVLGNYNNAYADNLSLTVGAANLAPAPLTPPVSTVGQLDHLFMVYMENKGVTDIVGSPNAPYLNTLINTYGYGSNYYALTHPSDPNYYPIVGGSDFGINYNCPANCFAEPNLADNIEAAHETWAGYMQGGGGYTTPTDRLPFLAFSDIYNNPARVAAHLFDLSQLGPDLASTATAPNFAWIAADDATNMEGPTGTVLGVVQWALSQLTNHQYNVAAGDAWLQDNIPVIMNSPVWNDPTQKSAIVITFDEDYNNISLGIGNQGNNVVTVVIPSPAAVSGGMRGGHFVADDYNNHYSLLRTIEDSLRLPPLTNNDRFAAPMNDYWV